MSPNIPVLFVVAAPLAFCSCSTTRMETARSTGAPELVTAAQGGPSEVSRSVTPRKARPGAKRLRYSILEILVPARGNVENALTRQLQAAAADGRTDHVILPSLRELSQTRGVDLMTLGDAREGQTLHVSSTRPLRYAIEFKPDGTPLSYEDNATGVTASFRGELEGTKVRLKGDVKLKELLGFVKYRLPAGAEVLQPSFSSRGVSDEFVVPTGGAIVFLSTRREDEEKVEDKLAGGLITKISSEITLRFLGVGVSVE